ncbi:hypothetical protein M0813_05774 [Anaeramoeba flamelloides]|uniref:Uncharacterized protein n=1 Tax=Anaeramoeba flamelloides TaxID=1746091 RepID=A0AAV8ACD7_9EUKA|nr:hypothetical protein M0812_04980 [Anaeramoeba flamelloides]KAJ6231701.1 hypothetical protein M0813_05774 [Anaeramoeba flamelloides]
MSSLNPQNKKKQQEEEDISSEFSQLSGNKKVAKHLLTSGSMQNKYFDSTEIPQDRIKIFRKNKGSSIGKNRGRNPKKSLKSGLTISIENTENEKDNNSGKKISQDENKQRGKSPLREEQD